MNPEKLAKLQAQAAKNRIGTCCLLALTCEATIWLDIY
jgi:hypothetical protein